MANGKSTFYDELTRKLTEEERENDKHKELIAAFDSAKAKLTNNIYGQIAGAEPSLSDHGVRHIDNVLDNAYQLLQERGKIKYLNAIEVYCLGMMVLFHDVGNLFGRAEHHKKIAEVYDFARGKGQLLKAEKTLILRAAAAHTGLAHDGSKDTLNDIPADDHFERRHVRLRELAAVLRLADELAEGPQRTSAFMRDKALFDEESLPFHQYAAMTNILIDRGNNRIALKYEFDIEHEKKPESLEQILTSQLRFFFARIHKLDQERRYNRYYSAGLEPFRTTEVTFNFHYNDRLLSLNVPTLVLTDKIVPGSHAPELDKVDSNYRVEFLVTKLIAACRDIANA